MEATNPYQSPTRPLNLEAGEAGEIKLLSPQCRIGRLRYLARLTATMLISYFAMIALSILIPAFAGDLEQVLSPVIGLMISGWLAVAVICTIFAIQRLHDLNLSGWFSLLMLVPLLNFLMSLLLILWPGTAGANRYGNRPPSNRWYHWFLALMVPVLIGLIGILAAVAIPAYHDYVQRAEELRLRE